MPDIPGVADLSAPRLAELRLQTLVESLVHRRARVVLARFLTDSWRSQGRAEHYAHALDLPLDLVEVPRHLVDLRHAGWLHQRPAAYGLLSRLRRDDLYLRFPDTMRSLRVPLRLLGRPATADLEERLRRLASYGDNLARLAEDD